MMIEPHSNLLSCIEINPPKSPIGCVIWLHGLGASGDDFVPMVPELQLPETLPLRFIFPHAPERAVTINQGYVMRAWYDIISISVDRHADQEGIDQSTQFIAELIQDQEKKGIPANKIVLAGFSQGAVMALTAGLTYPKRLAGIIALSGYLPNAATTLKSINPISQTIPIFLAHGKTDSVVPFELGQIVNQALTEHRYPVTWRPYPIAHSVCLEEIRDIAKWLETSAFPIS